MFLCINYLIRTIGRKLNLWIKYKKILKMQRKNINMLKLRIKLYINYQNKYKML